MKEPIMPGHLLPFLVLTTCLAMLSGCDAHRRQLIQEQYPAYPDEIRGAIDRGQVLRGMTRDQVNMTLGTPVCRKESEREGKRVEVWLYPPIGRDACVTADFRVYFAEGAVLTWDHFKTPTRWTDPPGSVPDY